MIKIFSTIAAAAAIISAGTAASAAVGNVVGNVYSTDILATVNGEPIPSYALDGKTAIALRDLEHYGFSVYYSESSRLAQANLDMHSIKEYTPIEGAERGTVGEITGNIYESDITAYINREPVSSYNIGGRLVVVIEDIAPHDDGSEFSQYG